ncbi:hypothetical protein [Burkholderia cenocepacia]|uniref:hypothetical protein n=1 Tax=Burkholderia cenocepacia TaxID=95486 RepID=UPI00222EE623|nr:hypothetical protein [Burkholderia cenocepacia]MCW3498654.1 hypothetical protein [Burkholderia cenocepacia]MCW3506258.1 hypothetical protein [Burkholderia cenocepacia]MCW3513807.1 hypothetical protein [Burkholderia cenocepacia]MCW3528957.1 hypothetical protein [Burkholderia cenocepacia]MCW3544709.1 hypothetical protein [Burkholderia cenocepacia]
MNNKLKTKEEITQWLDKMRIKNYSINDDLTVNVNGMVFLNGKRLTGIPVQFNKVSKSFDCSQNQLTSLDGAPRIVGKSFDCSQNQLTSLKGGPQIVGSSFICSQNQLTSLEGSPQIVGKDKDLDSRQNQIAVGLFDCSCNRLTSLDGVPQTVREFYCQENNTSLAQIVHFKESSGIKIASSDYTNEEIQKAIEIIALHETVDKAVKQKDELPMARAVSNTQMSATQTGKRKI